MEAQELSGAMQKILLLKRVNFMKHLFDLRIMKLIKEDAPRIDINSDLKTNTSHYTPAPTTDKKIKARIV